MDSLGSTVPREVTEGIRTITTDNERAKVLKLRRGQYRVEARVELEPGAEDFSVYDREIPLAIPLEDEYKFVYVYRISLKPIEGETHEGRPVGKLVVVFHVIDNFVWLPAALYAATAGISVIGGWFLIDKVETFSKSGTGAIVTMAAALGTLLLIWKSYGGS